MVKSHLHIDGKAPGHYILEKATQMCESLAGQAGALSSDKIEVTPAMVEAGQRAYWEVESEDVGSAELVRQIYLAMAARQIS